MESLTKLTKAIAKSHMYWGRKPLPDLFNKIFEDIRKGDIVLDPFCGGGNPAIAVLMRGGRVIACDLNPMAIFLTKVLIKPINLATLKSAFEDVSAMVSRNILDKYEMQCPNCKQTAIIKSLVWTNNSKEGRPEVVQMECPQCGTLSKELSSLEVTNQMKISQTRPKFWFPMNRIHSTRTPPVEHHYELFTGRNLSMLAELLNAIKKIRSENLRDALLYVFTAMLYKCSSMQMFSKKEPSSTRGWQALRFYIPPKRQEVNVWYAFENRFERFVNCKRALNHYMPSVRTTDSEKEFDQNNYEALISKADFFDFIRKFGKKANFVFLDPPYMKDIDYFGFSEFWGAWLQMDFDFKQEWHPKHKKTERLKELLMLLNTTTSKYSEVCLAYAPNNREDWNNENYVIESKYSVKRRGYFYYDNSNKRGQITRKNNRYSILSKEPSSMSHNETPPISKVESVRLLPYLRAVVFLYSASQPNATIIIEDGVPNATAGIPLTSSDKKVKALPDRERRVFDKARTFAAQFVPDRLQPFLRDLSETDIEQAVSDRKLNVNTYHSLCYSLLRIILSKDGWKISYVDPAQFEDKVFGMIFQEVNCIRYPELPKSVAFVAQTNDNKKMLFYFDDQAPTPQLANIIMHSDRGEFNNLCVMIVRDMDSMKNRRGFTKADKWPRVFFLCFEEIQRKAEKLNAKEYSQFCAPAPIPQPQKRSPIMSVTAEVKENIPVGENKTHYKLRFKSAHSFNIIPGQFIMMATVPQRQDKIEKPLKWDDIKPSSIETKPYLKRPFGIHRAFYRYFSEDKAYLQKLSLPPELATVLHTVYPNKFEIFYKVLANGIGTKELSKLQKGDKIQILGPLGKGQNIRELRDAGFDEIHVIGGGVGMAPLIFIVQALRYYSYKVKAFIGTEKIGTLKYKHGSDGLTSNFLEEPHDATIYIDDLIETGLDRADIYVSSSTSENIVKEIHEGNFYNGFVSDQYKNYLKDIRSTRNILAFACGPMGMMHALVPITTKYHIPLKVLMEKRMACGIGVCLSCVCETKKEGENESKYSRVCTDGPIFDASEIVWKKIIH